MNVNISVTSSNTSSELGKPASEPVISSNKTTGSDLKKPASAVILITPNSAKNEPKISCLDRFPGYLLCFAFVVLILTTVATFALKSYDYVPEICKIFKEKFGNDTSMESEFVSRVCKYEERIQNFIDYAMNFLHLILTIISCACILLAQSKFQFGVSCINLTMNLLVSQSYATGSFVSVFRSQTTCMQFMAAFILMASNLVPVIDRDVPPVPEKKQLKKPPTTKPLTTKPLPTKLETILEK